MATPLTLSSATKGESSDYGISTEPGTDHESWDSSQLRNRAETPSPVQKVNSWMKNNTMNGEIGNIRNGPDFIFFRYDSHKPKQRGEQSQDGGCDNNCDPVFYISKEDTEKSKAKVKSCVEQPLKKSGRPKDCRKSQDMPCFTETPVESDAASCDVSLSPENEQKRELCSYLQLMKPSDKKQVILLQNRRSTRVKNLCLMQEKKELEKRLKEEKDRCNGDDPEKYPTLKSFKELNINLDKNWFTNEKTDESWLQIKEREFAFPKPPSVLAQAVDNFENSEFSWINTTEVQLENGSTPREIVHTTPKSSKMKEKVKNGKVDLRKSINGSPKRMSSESLKSRRSSKSRKRKSTEISNEPKKRHTSDKLFIVPKPLPILNEVTVDFDDVMQEKLDSLKKIGKMKKVKKKQRKVDKKHKSERKVKKVSQRTMYKIKLFSSKSKKHKLIPHSISHIMESLSNGQVVKKARNNKNQEGGRIRKDKTKIKLDKKKKEREKVLKQTPVNEVLKENKKPENTEEKQSTDIEPITKQSSNTLKKSFTNLFTDFPRVAGQNFDRSPTPETLEFIDEQQFSLLSEEHQRALIESRIPIMAKLRHTKFESKVKYKSRSVSPANKFIQDFQDIQKQEKSNHVSIRGNVLLNEGSSDELKGFASEEQEFRGFEQSPEKNEGIKLYLARYANEDVEESCSVPLARESEEVERDQELKNIVPFKKSRESNSLARNLTSPKRRQRFKTNLEVQQSPQSWGPGSPSHKQKISQHSIVISPVNGSILKVFYFEYNLVLCQETVVSFWTQTALGNVLGAQNMWISKGTIQRLVMDTKCVFKESLEMVVSTDTNVAYVELWMKEHESDLRQRPVADVFATVYFWKKGQKGIEKKVLQLENINGFADDVQYSVLKYASKIIVSWHTAGTQLENRTTSVHCYDLAADYQTVSNIFEFESVNHYVSSLHNVEDCEGLIMGCGENNITLWNVEYGEVVSTVTMTDVKPPLSTFWVKCDRGFLFTLQQCADRELRMIAIKGMDGTWKKLANYVPPEDYDRLKGVCVENGLVLAFYDQGIHCWNAKTGESIVEECHTETGYVSNNHVITIVNDQVYVRHAVTHLLSAEEL